MKANIETQLSLSALANVDHSQSAGNIHSDRLFQINVLAADDCRLQVPRMEVRRSGDDDRINVLRSSNLLVGLRAAEKLGRIESRESLRLL